MIQFFFTHDSITLKDRKKLKAFIEQLIVEKEIKLVSLSIIFCNDDYLLDINKQFLNHDFFTDIITFNLSGSDKLIEGEIYISVDRVKENASKNFVSIKDELHRVIFHGVLHLCGYKDKAVSEKKVMTMMENECLKRYFLVNSE